MIDLKLSGYNEREREDILKGGINTYSKLRIKESQGKRSFYRSYIEQSNSCKDKNEKVKKWFKTGNNGDKF